MDVLFLLFVFLFGVAPITIASVCTVAYRDGIVGKAAVCTDRYIRKVAPSITNPTLRGQGGRGR
jgi:multisubunit Na+/H+ antiporter MnhG subunit